MSRVVGETFLKCEQKETTDALNPSIHNSVATYREADDLRTFTVAYTMNYVTGTISGDKKIDGIGDDAYFTEMAGNLEVVYGNTMISAAPGLKDMGGGDPLALDKKVINAVVGRVGKGG